MTKAATQIELIPESPPEMQALMVAIEDIEPPDGALQPSAALIESVRRFGILQPLLLRRDARRLTPEGPAYNIVDGRRRYRAALRAEQVSVPVIVALTASDVTADVMTLATGTLRSDNSAEEMRAVLDLMKAGATEADIQAATGLSKAKIRALARLEALNTVLRDEFVAGRIAPGVAEAAARLPAEYQAKLATTAATRRSDGKQKRTLSSEDVSSVKRVRAEAAQVAVGEALLAPSQADDKEAARAHLRAAVELVVPQAQREAALMALADALDSWIA